MIEVFRQTIFIHRDEKLVLLEILEENKIKYFAYTYVARERHGNWMPVVRWDNFENIPHVEKYDENGGLIERMETEHKTRNEVIQLVTTFRKNLLAMNLGGM
ncbi:MAG: hypothetical protein QW620_07325 [Thermoplasmata archaeon]